MMLWMVGVGIINPNPRNKPILLGDHTVRVRGLDEWD